MIKQWMGNAVLVGRGLRALLTLPQNRAWSRSILTLLVLNLVVLIVWRSGWLMLGQGGNKPPAEPVQPQWLAIHAPWQDHADTDSAREGSIRVLRCRRWGPFNAIDLRRVDQLLADWGGERKLITETEPIAYVVYWPESAKETARFMNDLRIKGFADAMVSTSEDVTRGHVMYGTFRSRGQARAKVEFLAGKGFPGATLYTRMGPPKTVYELRGDEDQIEALTAIRAKFDFGELTACNRNSDAASH